LFNLLLIAAVAASAPASNAEQASRPALSASAEADLKCLTLAFVAAGTDKDQKRLQSAIAASWYFLGRLDVSAPGLDLDAEANRALAAMKGDPKTKDVGASCDARFSQRGTDLVNLGKGSQKANP
jgi:hypothetical protein